MSITFFSITKDEAGRFVARDDRRCYGRYRTIEMARYRLSRVRLSRVRRSQKSKGGAS